MKIHLHLSCHHPINWNSVIKIVNAHKPNFISFCHYDDRDISQLNLEIPQRILTKFPSLKKYEHINMKLDEKPTNLGDHEIRLDVRLGASFSQIMIKDILGEECKFYSTSYNGSKLVRLDKQESREIAQIGPLELLELSGTQYSLTPVSEKPFNFDEYLPKIIDTADQAKLNSKALLSLGTLDPKTLKVRLTDSDGNVLDVDSRGHDGFWYEDIVMRKLAINFAGKKEVYANVTRNQSSENKQIRLGLQRIVNKLEQQTDLVIGELTNLFGNDVSNLAPDEISEIIQGTSAIDLKGLVDEMVYNLIFSTGAKNEFDGFLVGANGIETVEIKTSLPKLKQARKLETFSRYHSPVKGSRMYLVTNFISTSKDYERRFLKLRRNLGLEKIDVLPIAYDNLF